MAVIDVVGGYERVFLNVALHDHQILVDNWRTGRAPFVIRIVEPPGIQRTEVLLPEQFAVEIVGVEAFRTEKRHDVFSVGNRRRRGLAGLRMTLGLWDAFMRHA